MVAMHRFLEFLFVYEKKPKDKESQQNVRNFINEEIKRASSFKASRESMEKIDSSHPGNIP
jgi:hypothetical protein